MNFKQLCFFLTTVLKEQLSLKTSCQMNCSRGPYAESWINEIAMQGLEREVRAEQERWIPLVGVTGEVIQEGRLLLRGDSNRRGVLKREV